MSDLSRFTTNPQPISRTGGCTWGDEASPWEEVIDTSEGISVNDSGVRPAGLLPEPDALVAQWPFTEAGGSVAADTVGSFDASINGSTWRSGTGNGYGDAYLSFNGSGDYNEIPHDGGLSGFTELTVSAWINVDAISNGHQRIVSLWENGVNAYQLFVWQDGKGGGLSFEVDADFKANITDTQQVQTGSWVLATGTYDGSEIRVFEDTVERGAAAVTGQIPSTTNAVYHGRDAGTKYFFDGLIDRPMIWSTALTPAQISDWYDATESLYK